MHTVNILRHLIENYQIWVYVFIFCGIIFEGELILISSGIFLHLGALSFCYTLLFIVLGLLLKTYLGYYLGTVLHRKWNHTKFLKHIEARVSKIMPHFKEKPFWSIFISKFIMGANNIVILFSGFHKVDFKKYMKAEISSSILWVPLLLSLGYFFSYTAIRISHEIWRFSFIVLLLVIGFFMFDKLVSWIYEVFEEFHHSNSR